MKKKKKKKKNRKIMRNKKSDRMSILSYVIIFFFFLTTYLCYSLCNDMIRFEESCKQDFLKIKEKRRKELEKIAL